MSYQVLARKWRPRFFDEMVGQEHVLKALINALNEQRLHHAYLFTGTRGVGKTTIARILAKCLNCEQGISARPCGECSSCREIAEGRFVDLIEVDAASRTKVEDTRELLDNVQYAPTRGRFKVYLIDEVHMLSSHSFNALLKTLEEPPAHVKFLLATTDPQKLPVTILSRCLQFSLKNMTPERIVDYLGTVLTAEQIRYEEPALWQLGMAAQGSMRDALSLTDQAIAFGEGYVSEEHVHAMLGTMDRGRLFKLAEVMAHADPAALLREIADMAEHGPDYDEVLQGLLQLWHRTALAQVVPEAIDNAQGDREAIMTLANAMLAEDIQLFYQIGLSGRADMKHAPDPRQGFEMVLLRMLAFCPAPAAPLDLDLVTALEKKKAPALADESARAVAIDSERAVENEVSPVITPPEIDTTRAVEAHVSTPSAIESPFTTDDGSAPQNADHVESMDSDLPALAPHTWWLWVEQLALSGLSQAIARNSALIQMNDQVLEFDVDPVQGALFNDAQKQRIEAAIQHHWPNCRVIMQLQTPRAETPEQRRQREQADAFYSAKQSIEADPVVNHILSELGGFVIEQSIRPIR
ncbi:MAG: DNA polymerase III subunit gamma/tau [Bacterioplanes sp.]|nr:DNA polymerase III subunit gamma/tau [Bacterioplanes sp.]